MKRQAQTVYAARLIGTPVFDPIGDQVGTVYDVVALFRLKGDPLAVGLVVIVTIQSGKSAGLSGAIAGGSGDTYLGKNKNKGLDAKLALATKWVGGVFIVLTLVLNLF